ncbi:MAG: hypothetical protein HPY53_04490 [Brevinematales bacterium]|nr:hypothetical protein [Brevinematales bacterium]
MKLLIPVIALLFSSCALFHFFPPAVNNVINDTHWSEAASISNIDAANYSICVGDNDTLFFSYIETSIFNPIVKSYDNQNSIWNSIDNPATTAYSVLLKYRQDFGMFNGYIDQSFGGMISKWDQGSTWQPYTSLYFGSPEVLLWDYAISTGSIFVIFYDNGMPGQFRIQDLNQPFASDPWKDIMGSPYSFPDIIVDLSIDVDSFGKIFAGAGFISNCAIFYTINDTSRIYNFTNAHQLAKVVVDGFDNIYGVYLDQDGLLSVSVFHVWNDNLNIDGTARLYPEQVYIDTGGNAVVSVVPDKNRGYIYVGFIDADTYKPHILKVAGDVVSPMLGLPGDLTNSECIKLSIDMDGNPVAAVEDYTGNVRIFTKW